MTKLVSKRKKTVSPDLLVPKELFSDEWDDKISTTAKFVYAFMLDRLSLCDQNDWYDDDGEAFIIYPRDTMKRDMKFSDDAITKAIHLLVNNGLITVSRKGLGQNNIIKVSIFER